MPPDPWLSASAQSPDARCPICATPLLNLQHNHCPRCHASLAIGLTTTEGYLIWWGAFLGALCALAGFGLFFGTVILIRGPFMLFRGGELATILLIAIVALGPIAAVAATLTIRSRRRFCRLPHNFQRTLALCTLALSLLQFIGFFKLGV